MNQNRPEVPEVPKEATSRKEEKMIVNQQCADVENWDDKAFPLMIEPLLPTNAEPEFTTLSLESAETLLALLTKRLTFVVPAGVFESPPVVEAHPDIAPLAQWLRAAAASLRSRRSQRSRTNG